LAGLGALVGLGLEGLRALLAHGFVDQEADAFGQAAGGAVVSQSCRTVFKSSGSVRWVVMDLLWMCLVTPQQEPLWPALDQF